MILQPAYMKYIWENIVYFIDKPNFQAKSELLNALISLIFASENLFKAFSTVTLYKILDYLTDSDWFRRKLALNVVYTLIIYCQEEILPLKGHIVEFLKVLKSDKVKEVREVCMQTLKLFNEISEEEVSVTEREKFENNDKNEKNEKSDNFPHFNNLTTENDRRDTFTKDEPKRDKSFFKNISAIEMNDLSSDSINVRELPSTKHIINNSTKSPRARINTNMNQNNAVANSMGNSQLSPLGSRIKERKIEKEKDDRRKIKTPDKKMEHTGNSVPQSSSTGINNINSNTLGQYIQRSKPNQMNSINNFVRKSVKKSPKEEDDTLPLNISDIKTDDPVKNKFINVNKLKKDKDEGTTENLVNGITNMNSMNSMNPSSLQKRPVTPTKLNTKQITNTEEDICNSNNLNTNPNRELNGQINRNEDGKFVNSKMVIKRDPNYSIFKTKVNNEFFSNAPKEEQIQIIVAEKKEKLQNETQVEQSEPLMNYVKENPRIEQKQRNKDMPRAIDQHHHENTNMTSNSEESLRKQQDSGISQLSLKIEKDSNVKSQAQIQNNHNNQNNHKTQEYIYHSNVNSNQNKLEDVLKQMKFLSDKQIFLIDSIEKIQECSKKENEELQGRIKQLEGQVQHLMEFIKNFEKNENLRHVSSPSDKEREIRPKIEKEENLESFGNTQLSNHDYSNNNNQIHNTHSNYAYSSNVVPTASFNTFNYESNTIYKHDFDSFGGNLNPSQSARTLVNNYARKGNSNVWNEILLELKVKYK